MERNNGWETLKLLKTKAYIEKVCKANSFSVENYHEKINYKFIEKGFEYEIKL